MPELLPGTQQQIEEWGEKWWLATSTVNDERWYIAGYYCRVRGENIGGQEVGDNDAAVQAWLMGWHDAHGDLIYS